ncbi:hypothetical protein COLO4_02909 [Corchorus olitorius]|uniref:Uncharacterized protein n=1 Tax=Corchorus olitorius TaxID=93759 RepID=A0A1R3I4W2_9ROSI|nr:hypothetical protein COLO4_36812 [Corchorus olitorius]OMO55571.1 hypothetical protein COLO4_35919 [Corchorus olitorius]OMO77594.1 hypothetical protein COLO4_25073 [Corchorus olitorius]OMO81139.1 hypothetical protein COLO4_23740 [Corchorus olitorius]OMO86097.1 hypothetical protein COLO4_21309 [Corchorus olitorius]
MVELQSFPTNHLSSFKSILRKSLRLDDMIVMGL